MDVVFSSLAVQELDDATNYYELQLQGLGEQFRDEVELAARQISQHPEAWTIERNEIRRYLVHRFPYKVIYSIETDHIFVIAIAHQHREPFYWVER